MPDIYEAIKFRLNDSQQKLIHMVICGMTQDEIADHLKFKQHTVSEKIETIRKILSDFCPPEKK